MTAEQRKIIEEWRQDMKLIFGAHYASCVEAQKLNCRLGIPVVALSAIVGTSSLADLASDPLPLTKIVVGLTSLLVAVLASLQTFLRYSERAEMHRKAGAKFAALHKEIDHILVCPPKDVELGRWMATFRKKWDRLSLESPTTSPRSWKRRKMELQTRQENDPPRLQARTSQGLEGRLDRTTE